MQSYGHGGDVYGLSAPVLDFSVNLNPLGMPEAVKRAIAGHVDDYARYPDPYCRRLTAALASRLSVPPETVLFGNGAADLIYRLTAALRPQSVLVTAPAFSEYEKAARLYGAEVRFHPLRRDEGFRLTPRILDSITKDVALCFLCNPNNPTGALSDPALTEEIAARCKQTGTVLVMDECFLDFTEGASVLPLLSDHPNLVLLGAFTKLYAMAGVRLGYLITENRALLERTRDAAQAWSVSAVAETAGLAALGVPGWKEQTRALVKAERAYLASAFSARGMTVFPGDANFLLFESPAPLRMPLLERGFLIRACGNYRGLTDAFYRVGVKTRPDNDRLLSALDAALSQ